MPLPKIKRLKDINGEDTLIRNRARTSLGSEKSIKDCARCKRTVWIDVYFDGTGNNFRKDDLFNYKSKEAKQSNIAKLAFFGWPDEDEKIFVQNQDKARYRIYVPGLGTPFPEIGDTGKFNEVFGNATAMYGEQRLEWAMDRVREALSNHVYPPIERINISIFGFSRGATLARAFARILDKKYGSNDALEYRINADQTVPMEIYFMGLLDTVASVGFGGSRLEKSLVQGMKKYPSLVVKLAGIYIAAEVDKGGHYGWANDLSIPGHVSRWVHYVASHECREKFPADSVRQMRAMPDRGEELYYPGMHSDVGGGYLPNDQEDRTNELSRVALNNLYYEAWRAGVPLRSPKEIETNYPGLFDISAEVDACFNEAMRGITDGNMEHQVIQHMNRYYAWRCRRLRRLQSGDLKPNGDVDKWMKITDREFAEDLQELAKIKDGKHPILLEPLEEVLHREDRDSGKLGYIGTIKPDQRTGFDKHFDLFFDKYVHDSIAGLKGQIGPAEKSRYTLGRAYFCGKKDEKHYYWRYSGKTPQTKALEQAALKKANQGTQVA